MMLINQIMRLISLCPSFVSLATKIFIFAHIYWKGFTSLFICKPVHKMETRYTYCGCILQRQKWIITQLETKVGFLSLPISGISSLKSGGRNTQWMWQFNLHTGGLGEKNASLICSTFWNWKIITSFLGIRNLKRAKEKHFKARDMLCMWVIWGQWSTDLSLPILTGSHLHSNFLSLTVQLRWL